MVNRRSFLFLAGAAASLPSNNLRLAAAHALSPSEPRRFLSSETTEQDPFRRAVIKGDLATVKCFVENNAALIYGRNENGESVYLLACYAGQRQVAEFFVSQGLSRDFNELVASGEWKIVQQILAANPGYALTQNPRGDFPSHTAVLARQPEYLFQFAAFARDFNARSHGRYNRTPVHLAAMCLNPDDAEPLMQNLLMNGGSPTSADINGETPLHLCATTNNLFSARMLLRKGADPIAKNKNGETPLDIAKRARSADMIDLLEQAHTVARDYYAQRFTTNRDGATVQRDDTQGLPQVLINEFVIVSHFSPERMQKLLRQCPDLLNTRSSFDELAVEAGAHSGRQDIAGFLLDRGAPYSICTAAMFGETKVVKRMIEEDSARIRERGPHDFLITFYPAFGTGSIEVMEILAARGADLASNVRERNALHVAAEFGQIDLSLYLVSKGLNPRQKAFTFKGYLDAIELARDSKHPELANMLAKS